MLPAGRPAELGRDRPGEQAQGHSSGPSSKLAVAGRPPGADDREDRAEDRPQAARAKACKARPDDRQEVRR